VPVYEPQWVAPAPFGYYPNLQRRDAAIWERVLRARAEGFKRVCYNLAFGGSIPLDPQATQDQILGWQYSTAAKVDVLIDLGDEWWLCEVKPNASYSAVGQVLSYYLLAEREGFTTQTLVPTIITDGMLPDVAYVAQTLNLQVILAPDPALNPPEGAFTPIAPVPGSF
jgi:hypothetical protein